MNILILMAGAAKDFEEKGHSYPKYLLEIQNKPIIQRIVESLINVGNNITFIIKQEDQEKFYALTAKQKKFLKKLKVHYVALYLLLMK